MRQEILSRDGHQCVNCGAQTSLEVHHVVPLSQGGTNKSTNLVTVCRSCHAGSHEQTVHVPNEEIEEKRWLPTINEVRKLARTTHHPLKRAIIGVLVKTGIGVGELCNLHLQDVFLDDKDVSEAYGTREPNWVESSFPALRIRVDEGEKHSPRRERAKTTQIPLDEQTGLVLKHWLAIRPDSHRKPRSLFLSTRSWRKELSRVAVHSMIQSRAAPLGFTNSDSELNTHTVFSSILFPERFPGQPTVRDQILRGHSVQTSFEQLVTRYTYNIYSIF